MWIIQFVGIIFTYLGASLVIFLLLARLMQTTKQEATKLFFLTLGLGPITISWLLTRFLSIFPGHSDLFYVTLVAVCFFLPFSFCLNKLHLLQYIFQKGLTKLREFHFSKRWFETSILLMVFALMGAIFFLSTTLPITENDAVQYATVSRMIHEYKSIDFYPVIKPDPQTGFYAVSTHPLGYISLMTWSYMLQGSSQYAGLIKLISPMYVLYSLLILWYVLLRQGKIYGVFGMLLLITTPAYYMQSAYCGIDAIRIYTFFLAFVCLLELIRNHCLWQIIFTGFVIGMSMYSHSVGGVFTLPFFVFIYFIKSKEKYSKRIFCLTVIIVVALLFGGSRYMSNYQTFGFPVYDDIPINQLKEVAHADWVKYNNRISDFTGQVIYGGLKGFTNIIGFGVSYWFFALALILSIFKFFKADMISSIFLWIILLFYGLLWISIIIGQDVFISNYRYILTIQPFISFWGALSLGYFYEKVVSD